MKKRQLYLTPGLKAEAEKFHKLLKGSSPDHHILISGPRGTGKSYFLESYMSAYELTDSDVVRVNCATISPSLAESALFGHVKGSFTGADENRTGYIQEANDAKGKTLILEELNSIPPEVQAKLLLFMERGEYMPLGSSKVKLAPVRVVATMNHEADTNEIRKDLRDRFWICANVPPLHLRRQDILYHVAKLLGHTNINISELQYLFCHHWPGNVRELCKCLWQRQQTGRPVNELLQLETHYATPLPGIHPTYNPTLDAIEFLKARGLSAERYEEINSTLFGGLFPAKTGGLLYLPPEVNVCIREIKGKETVAILLKGQNTYIDAGVIQTFYELVYGGNDFHKGKPICELVTFKEDNSMRLYFAIRKQPLQHPDWVIHKPKGVSQEHVNECFHDFIITCNKAHFYLKNNNTEYVGINTDTVARYLIHEKGRFQTVLSKCYQLLGNGAQKKLAEFLGISTSAMSRWLKKMGIT